ncbi:MAG: hypothetical protein WA484_03195 [Solirubrobacteraceae bacterium]
MSKPPEDKPDGARLPAGHPPTGRRVRGPQLTERDGEILRWMTRHGVVTAELVGRRFFWRPGVNDYGKWAAYRRLRALRTLGLVLKDKTFVDHPEVLRVTREGARIADVGIRPAPLVLSQLRHSIAVVWLTEYLLAENADAELTTERELRAERYRELRDGTRETEHGRAPDALLRIPVKGAGAQGVMTVAVELDLTRKDRRAMERMVRQYDRERVDRIWWYVTPARLERTRALVRELRADNRIEVRAWPG